MITSKKKVTFKGHFQIDPIFWNDLLSKWSISKWLIFRSEFFEVNFEVIDYLWAIFSKWRFFEVAYLAKWPFFGMDHFRVDEFKVTLFVVNNFRSDWFQNDPFCEVTLLSFTITYEISTIYNFYKSYIFYKSLIFWAKS